MSTSERLNNWISKNIFFAIVIAALTGFNLKVNLPSYTGTLIIILFAYMTFVTSLGTSLKDFLQIVKKPRIPLWIFILSHLFMPILAAIMGYLIFPDNPYIRIGFILAASIPIGVTSIIWTSMTGGSVSVTIVALTIDTLIIPVFLPSFFALIIGQSLEINYIQMGLKLLLMVTIPSICGMITNDYCGKKLKTFAKGIGGFTAKLSLSFVVFINALSIAPMITWDLWIFKIMLMVLFMVFSGYLTGFLGSFALKDREEGYVSSMIYTIGMRNISFGLVLALAYFPPLTSLPVILGCLFQQPLAALISNIMKKHPSIFQGKKIEEKSAIL